MCIMEPNAVHRRCKGPSSFSFNNPADGWFVSGILVGWGRGQLSRGFGTSEAAGFPRRPGRGVSPSDLRAVVPESYWARLS